MSGGVRREEGGAAPESPSAFVWTTTMDHSLFGCLRSPHAPTQGLHPATTLPPLALHHGSGHMLTDLAASSPSCDYGAAEDCGGSEQHKQSVLHPQNTPSWPGPPPSACVPPPEAARLRTGSPDQRGTSVQTSGQAGTPRVSSQEPDRSKQSPGTASLLLITSDHH